MDGQLLRGGSYRERGAAPHERSLALALRSRDLVRTVAVITAGAVGFCADHAGIGRLALPAIWKYIRVRPS
jgi:hypothetical protein